MAKREEKADKIILRIRMYPFKTCLKVETANDEFIHQLPRHDGQIILKNTVDKTDEVVTVIERPIKTESTDHLSHSNMSTIDDWSDL